MAGITQKSCVALFPLWSLKKTFLGGRTNVNQQKQTKIQNFDKKSFSMMTTLTITVISVITKIKNSNSNNSNYQKR